MASRLYICDRRLSIVIPSARTFPRELVKSLQSQTEKTDEILVIRNGSRQALRHWAGIATDQQTASTDGDALLTKHSASLAIAETNSTRIIDLQGDYGAAAARNRGWQEASNDSVLFLDDDVAVDDTFLKSVRRHIEGGPGVGVTTFRMRGLNTSPWSSVVESTISLDRGEEIRRSGGIPLQLRNVWMYGAGGAMLATRSLLKVTGGFKHHFGAGRRNGGTEDMEFLWHASRHTSIEYCGTIFVQHDDVCTTEALCRKLREYGRGIGHLGGAAAFVESIYYVCGYCRHIMSGIRLHQVNGHYIFFRLKTAAARAIFETALVYLSSRITSSDADVFCSVCRGEST